MHKGFYLLLFSLRTFSFSDPGFSSFMLGLFYFYDNQIGLSRLVMSYLIYDRISSHDNKPKLAMTSVCLIPYKETV